MSFDNDEMQVEYIKTVERSKSNTHRISELQESLKLFQDETRAEIGKIHEEYKILSMN